MAKNWSGTVDFKDLVAASPASLEELQSLIAASEKVRARGSAHCFNDIADTSATSVSLANMSAEIAIDKESRTVRVPAGLKYGELAAALNERGWAIHNMASLPHISVAGAVATATHGSGVGNGNLATAVVGLEIVLPDGSLKRVSKGDANFEGYVVGLGLTGVVVNLDLAIEPTFNISQTVYRGMSRESYAANLDEIMSLAYSVSYFTTWAAAGGGEVWAKFRSGTTAPTELFEAYPATSNRHPLPGLNPEPCTEQMAVSGPWHLRLPHFKMEFTPSAGDEIQSEFFVARKDAPAAIAALEKIAPQINEILWVTEIRAIAADELWMSPHYQRDSIGIHFTWKKVDAVYEMVKVVEATLAPFNYRPHLGKVFSASPEYLDSVMPKMEDFKNLVNEIDPVNKFGNVFTDKLLGR
ncbi:FAD linked oxidase, N-terminal [Candidatus Nanopelagicaceae bacterium]